MQASAYEIEDAENRILNILKENSIGVVEDDTLKGMCSDLPD